MILKIKIPQVFGGEIDHFAQVPWCCQRTRRLVWDTVCCGAAGCPRACRGLLPKEDSFTNSVPNICRVSLATSHQLPRTAVRYNPEQEWPMRPLLPHPCKAAPRGTAQNTATTCKNHPEYQVTLRKIPSQTIPGERKKKSKKEEEGVG